MILQTMTPEEKVRQMEKLRSAVLLAGQQWVERNVKKFLRTKVFPTYYTSEVDFSSLGMGRWVLVVEAESKNSIRKGICCCRAYQTYHVARAKDATNIGTGIWMLNADDNGNTFCNEFPPHFFHRLRERFIAPKGIVQPDFHQLVKMMMREHYNGMDETIKGYRYKKDETGRYGLVEDHSIDRQEGYDNLVTYMRSGISLGVSAANRRYFLWMTYVPNDLLYKEQIEAQKKELAKLRQYDYRKQLNPFETYDEKKWVVNE